MFCTTCGNNLAEGATFCVSCGNAVSDEATSIADDIRARRTPQPSLGRGDAKKVDDKPAQFLAALPIVVLLLSSILPAGSFSVWLFLLPIAQFIANAVLAVIDQDKMRKQGFRVAIAWGILLPPVYLLIRANRLQRGSWFALLWLGGWFFSIYNNLFF